MPWWFWIALGVFGVSIAAASCVALARTFRFFRAVRSFSRAVEPLAGQLTASADELDRRNVAFAAGQERARQSIDRLRSSILQVRVLVAALDEILLALRLLRFIRGLR
jgi:hypothetical protein